jgi:hypothetical protein
VSPTGTADQGGRTWAGATSFTNAIAIATPGDKIWVATGTYTPGTSRTATFTIPAGISVYGGFYGNESNLESRQIKANPTILSGNIGNPASNEDNSFTIVTMLQTGGNTVLDGFVLEGGNARDFDRNNTVATTGGALYIGGGKNGQGPIIANCIFIENQARNGGSVFVDGSSQPSNPLFLNCVFRNNKADFRGGAVYNEGSNGVANPIFRNCVFEDNKADRGACLLNQGTNGNSSPLITSSQFNNNQALSDGAIIYNVVEDGKGKTNQVMTDCRMKDNDSYLGNDISSNYQVERRGARPNANAGGGSLSPVNN